MDFFTEKRICERRSHTALMEFSFFNKGQYFEAQTLNHGEGGLRFKSEVFIKPGATVYLRVKKLHPNGPCQGDCRGLRSATLAEVKWCKEFLNGTEPFYEIGAKYFQSDY
jgi:hypothetical protein